jgi:hypothetical protein
VHVRDVQRRLQRRQRHEDGFVMVGRSRLNHAAHLKDGAVDGDRFTDRIEADTEQLLGGRAADEGDPCGGSDSGGFEDVSLQHLPGVNVRKRGIDSTHLGKHTPMRRYDPGARTDAAGDRLDARYP